MEHARNLLLSTDAALAEIALAIGFSDQSAFNKAFRRDQGYTPGKYRTVQISISIETATNLRHSGMRIARKRNETRERAA
jgi:AraC-like DNA-binding protein